MRDDIWQRDEIESPCQKICMIHPTAKLCVGCFRSPEEIATWGRKTTEERREIMEELPKREHLTRVRRGGRRRTTRNTSENS